jgi:hypothetical protein
MKNYSGAFLRRLDDPCWKYIYNELIEVHGMRTDWERSFGDTFYHSFGYVILFFSRFVEYFVVQGEYSYSSSFYGLGGYIPGFDGLGISLLSFGLW